MPAKVSHFLSLYSRQISSENCCLFSETRPLKANSEDREKIEGDNGLEEVSYADLDDREADEDVIEDLSDGEGTEDDARGLKDVDDANENGDVLAVGEVAAEKNDDLGVGKVAEDGEAVEENDILGDEEVAVNEGVAAACCCVCLRTQRSAAPESAVWTQVPVPDQWN